jgi:hypothetical protein
MTNIDNLISINRYVRIPQAWTGAKTTFIYEKTILIYDTNVVVERTEQYLCPGGKVFSKLKNAENNDDFELRRLKNKENNTITEIIHEYKSIDNLMNEVVTMRNNIKEANYVEIT